MGKQGVDSRLVDVRFFVGLGGREVSEVLRQVLSGASCNNDYNRH